jgi:hypothetical protein
MSTDEIERLKDAATAAIRLEHAAYRELELAEAAFKRAKENIDQLRAAAATFNSYANDALAAVVSALKEAKAERAAKLQAAADAAERQAAAEARVFALSMSLDLRG